MPNPAAAFSPLAMTRSAEYCFTSSDRRSLTIVRPGRPKMSPMKRMFKVSTQYPVASTQRKALELRHIEQAEKVNSRFRWYHAKLMGTADADGCLLGTGYWVLGTDFARFQKIVISRRI